MKDDKGREYTRPQTKGIETHPFEIDFGENIVNISARTIAS